MSFTNPTRFKVSCAWCPFYVDAAVESGAGEKAAERMREHIAVAHGRSWDEYRRAPSGLDAPGAPDED